MSPARPPRILPLVLGGLFGVWALRGLGAGGIVRTDAARHAMNGALIFDWLREGPWLDPGAYARWYYAHWPALSLGYHPPGVPMAEALAYASLGVGPLAARLVVAVATAASVWLLFQLVLATHRSVLLASTVVVTVFSLPLSLTLSQDVMLELPAMAFVLAALRALPPADGAFTTAAAVRFGLASAIAIGAKQLGVFVGAIPLGLAVLTGRRDWLRARPVWVATGLCAAAFAAIGIFEGLFGPAASRRFAIFRGLPRVLAENSAEYLGRLLSVRGAIGLGVAILLVAALGRTHRWRNVLRPNALYVAWAGAVMTALLLGKWASTRYLFFVYPPLVTLFLSGLHESATTFLSRRVAAGLLLMIATGAVALGLQRGPFELHGPAAAARLVAADRPARVLYAGESDGHFAFALRSALGSTDAIVIRGERLPDRTFLPETFEEFAVRYGITHVVLEETDRAESAAWRPLLSHPAPSMQALRSVHVSGYRQGQVHVYRFTSPSSQPAMTLDVAVGADSATRSPRLDWTIPLWRRPGGRGTP